jgi:hypothetical protein
MKKQPGCEKLQAHENPSGSCASSGVPPSPARGISGGSVEKMLVEESAQKELDGKNLSAE